MSDTQAKAPPKQARAIATRQKLLDAAAQCLCELGARGTTTTAVAKRAGVSQGALYKHFGSKHHLLAATTEHLFNILIEAFRGAFGAQATDQDRLSRVLQELWAVFLMPELYAVVELYIVARTDETLREALVPVLAEHRENLLAEARRIFPEAAAENPRFDMAVDGIMAAMQGAAMNAAVVRDLSQATEFATFVERVCRREFEPPYGVL
jgi:AcrR family transcriptional regulator